MSARIVRVSDEQRNALDPRFADDRAIIDAFDAAPDEATLPAAYWCSGCEQILPSSHIRGHQPFTGCCVVRVPLPVHLGVEVTP